MKYLILISLIFKTYAKISFTKVLHQTVEKQKQGFLNDYIVSYYGKTNIYSDSTYTNHVGIKDVITNVALKNNVTYGKARSILLSDLVLNGYRRLEKLTEFNKKAIMLQKKLDAQGRIVEVGSETYKAYKDVKAALENYDLDQRLFELDTILHIFVPPNFIPSVNVNMKNLTRLDRRLVSLQAVMEKRSAGVITILNSLINNTKDRLDVELARTSDPKSIIATYRKRGLFSLQQLQTNQQDEEEEYDLLERIFNKTTQAKLNFLSEYIALHLGNGDFRKFNDPESADQYLENYAKRVVSNAESSTIMTNAVKLGYLLETSKRISAQEEYVKTAIRLQIIVNEKGGKLNLTSDEYKKYREMQSKLDVFYEAVIEEQVPMDAFIRSFAPVNFVPSAKITSENATILDRYLKKLQHNSEIRLGGMIVLMNRLLVEPETPLDIDEAKHTPPNEIYRIIKNNLINKLPELNSTYV